jgi:GTP-binding protein Era
MAHPFKSGFVSIIGKPNAGKSTLLNRLVGEKLSIITPKAQTTRHRIKGIAQGPDYQIIFSDTPGILKPRYALHEAMIKAIRESLEDADLVLLLVSPEETADEIINEYIQHISTPLVIAVNKVDLLLPAEAAEKVNYWKEQLPRAAEVLAISASAGTRCDELMQVILKYLPEHPPFYDRDELTDRTERFLAAEVLREKIFLNLAQEVPYSTEVVVTDFKEEEDIIRIHAEIYVERLSQKGIVIGKNGMMLKKLGTEARKDLEILFGKKVFLETHVKVAENWRKERSRLKQFGYLRTD